jgi:hypothetical protein
MEGRDADVMEAFTCVSCVSTAMDAMEAPEAVLPTLWTLPASEFMSDRDGSVSVPVSVYGVVRGLLRLLLL